VLNKNTTLENVFQPSNRIHSTKLDSAWNAENEQNFKNNFVQKGMSSQQASSFADCAVTKMKEQN
jgi:hypothetical protein